MAKTPQRLGKEATKAQVESPTTTIQIFLSYVRKDEKKVEHLYQELSNAGFRPWMAKKDIIPGERWRLSIEKAIQDSHLFLACLSANSIDKRGWFQKEINDALDILQEMLDSDIYLIPVRLEDCAVLEKLRDFQWVNLFEENGWIRLKEAIRIGLERRGLLADKKASRGTEIAIPEEGLEGIQQQESYGSAGDMAVALKRAVREAAVEEVEEPSPVVVPSPETLGLEAQKTPAPPPAEPAPASPRMWAVIGVVVVVVMVLAIALMSRDQSPVTSAPEAAALALTATPTTAPTKTPTSVPPTSTPLPPTPTHTPTIPPTDTPTPTHTPTIPPTDTPTPTHTPIPPIATSVSPTPTPSPTSHSEGQPVYIYPAPVLNQPKDGANLGSNVTFSWHWDGRLQENEYFDLRMWPAHSDNHWLGVMDYRETPDEPDANGNYSVETRIHMMGNVERKPGEYFWSVAIICCPQPDGTMQQVCPEATPRKLTYAPGGGGDGDGDGDGDGKPVPQPP